MDDTNKERYINAYEREEGIRLDHDKIEKNSGLRSVAKFCLNSFRGNFGQRSNLNQNGSDQNARGAAEIAHDA